MPQLTREGLINSLTTSLAHLPACRAAWIAGSEANGRTDAYSDIDLVVLCRGDSGPAVLQEVRAALLGLSPIDIEWMVPQPTWHGHSQAFYRLAAAGPHLLIDVVAISDSTPESSRFLERERHGTPRVLFDPEGLVRPQPLDRATHEEKMRARLARIRVTFPLLQTLVIRSLERDLPTEAAWAYHNFTLLPLVEALRMAYCPNRFDFGLRYLRDDLPREEYQRVCQLALPGGMEGIRSAREEAEAWFGRVVDRLVGPTVP